MQTLIVTRSLNFYPRPPGGGRRTTLNSDTAAQRFLSTPSGWRATEVVSLRCTVVCISIHALRVEGDPKSRVVDTGWTDFYPRPPGGGRHRVFTGTIICTCDFYPRPPGGGRPRYPRKPETLRRFLSTPSGWRATAKTDKVFICFCAKGRRNCLFKTRKEKICRWRFKKDKFWVLIWCEGSGKSVCALASHCG